MNEIKTDVVVLGAGPAGYVCAIRLAQLGKKVTVVEREKVGGVCLNVGCIPSKALIYAGSFYEKIKHASLMGIETSGAKMNLKQLQKWKEEIVQKLTGGVSQLLRANGCTVISGEAEFISPKSLQIKSAKENTVLQFNHCVIATGSRPFVPPGMVIDQKQVCDSTGALSLTEIPKSMLCIGGGYIGLELGTFYAKLGTKVTVIEMTGSLLSGIDPDLTKVVARGLEKKGVEILLQTKVEAVKAGKKEVEVKYGNGKIKNFDVVLVTVGRIPNTDRLCLEKAGITKDAKGFIRVGLERMTSVPHIYAIGDAAGGMLLAHKGSKEGIVAAEAISGKKTIYDVRAMPAVIFTDPEIATVGLTEAEARAKGYTPQVGMFPFSANGRALSVGESEGFVKILGDSKTGKLLGVHIVGGDASNLISEAALALEMGAQVEDLALTVHPHPTLPETLMEAAEATLGQAIHIFQKKPATQPQLRI